MKVKIPDQFKFLFKPRRNKIMYGGRAGGKSWAIALALLIMGTNKKLRILCTRELQNSLDDSVHKLLSDMNDKYQLGYIVTNNSLKHPLTETEFMFYGLKTNITKIKSLEAVDICWVEEAETITERSLEVLVPTIRKEGSEIWMSFNPADENDAVYKQFITPHLEALLDNKIYADPDMYILKTLYSDNPFLPTTIAKEIEQLKAQDYRKYQHVYGGEPFGNDANCIIQPEWFDAAIDAHIKKNFEPKGVKVIGFDPADEGNDSKAAVMRHGSVIQSIDEWAEGNLEEGVERVYQTATDYRIQEIVYDSIGIGAGAKVKFNQYDPNWTIQFTSFIGGAKPDYETTKYNDSDMTNRDMFRNKRAQYYWLLRDRFENTYRAVVHNEYIDPDDMISISSDCKHIDQLKAELTKIQRKRIGNSSTVQIESKADMRKRGMKSPNIADSLIYVFADEGIANSVNNKPVTLNFVRQWV